MVVICHIKSRDQDYIYRVVRNVAARLTTWFLWQANAIEEWVTDPATGITTYPIMTCT